MSGNNDLLFASLLHPSSKLMGFVWQLAEGWPIIRCSESVVRRLRLPGTDLFDRPVSYAELVHPDDLPELTRIINARLLGDSKDVPNQIEYRLSDGRGGWRWVESDTLMNIQDSSDGRVVVGLVQDVTKRKEAQIEAQMTHERLELILDCAGLGMWDFNPNTGAVSCDKRWAAQIGYPLHEVDLDLSFWRDRTHPDDLEVCLKAMRANLRGDTDRYENIHRLRHKDGHWVHILDRGQVLERDEAGKPLNFVGTHLDISHLKQVEQQAVLALKTRDRFFSAVSHELRTPLHAILGIVELLEEELPPAHAEKASLVRENSEYLLNILKDILDVAKLDEDKMQLQEEPLEINALVAQVCKLFSARAQQKSLHLVNEMAMSDVRVVFADKVRLTQVLVNLLSNAIKYTLRGSVAVRLKEDGTDWLLQVVDTGPGIENTQAVFEPYLQEGIKADDVHSTGLGLTIARRLCERMGFVLEVESQLGHGSCFTIRVPKGKQRDLLPAQQATLKTSKRMNWSELKVLVVDDNAVNRMVVGAMLSKLAVKLDEAENGAQALQKMEVFDYDVICMDLHMPVMGGISAAEAIRQGPADKQPKIIALTADAYPETMAACLQAGMDDFLSKPFKRAELISLIEKLTG